MRLNPRREIEVPRSIGRERIPTPHQEGFVGLDAEFLAQKSDEVCPHLQGRVRREPSRDGTIADVEGEVDNVCLARSYNPTFNLWEGEDRST